jgi:dipeptidyl-peptidase-4
MRLCLVACPIVVSTLLLSLLLGGVSVAFAQQRTTTGAKPGELTVQRIFTAPSLGGQLAQGVAWLPDSKRLSYFETKGSGKVAKTELWVMEAATGKRSLLISAEKLETLLPARSSKQSQATSAGRDAPLQYHWAPGGDALLLEVPHSLAWFDLKRQTARVLVSGKEDLGDAKISPNGKYVSFVRNFNLWLVTTADGKERALTTGGSENVRKGELDWVYPEELGILTGYWWAPDSSAIAYLEMDERKVPQFPLVDFESFTGKVALQRYPVPGGANPGVRVLVAPVAAGEARAMDTGAETDIYIPRVNWLPDSKQLAIQRLNRAQTILDVLLSDTTTGKSATILSDKDAYWINVSDDLRFLKDGKRFLWSSERSGYRHLYLYDFSGKQPLQLTKGVWEVSHLDAVDEAKGVVYFTATEKSPLERHLYRVNLDGSGFTRITTENGTHHVNFAPNAAIYVNTYSDANTPPRQDLYRSDGKKLTTLNENKMAELDEYKLSPIEFFTIKAHDGMSLNCSMIKPPNFDPAKKYPVLVYTYGGPRVQVVVNAWTGNLFLWHQLMAQKGYIIFSLDNRGSVGRGHLFEEPLHYRFGAQELSDLRDGVQWLKAQPYMDGERIGIWGWGYGGYMTLHAMFEASQIFKVGFAGGPVADWHFYDTIYTERYIGPLPKYEDSYKESSAIENANMLRGKLLIAHGIGDDNVHYSNTLALIDDLIEAGKYVEVVALPGRGHEVSDPPAQRLLWERVTKFFLDNL